MIFQLIQKSYLNGFAPKFMKKLLVIFVLLFSSSVFADDIRDFQIEGMSIGDSLLDYFTEQKIKNNMKNYIKDKTFSFFEIYNPSLFENYESLQVSYKTGDIDYTIYGISGAIFYIDNIDECYPEKNKIVKELESLINDENNKKRFWKRNQ